MSPVSGVDLHLNVFIVAVPFSGSGQQRGLYGRQDPIFVNPLFRPTCSMTAINSRFIVTPLLAYPAMERPLQKSNEPLLETSPSSRSAAVARCVTIQFLAWA